MDQPVLNPEELAALRDAFLESSQGSPEPAAPQYVMPVALIAEDRAAENARPAAMQIGHRWAEVLRPRLSKLCGPGVEIDRVLVEVLEPGTLREEFLHAWISGISVVGRPRPALVTATGPIIERVAARLFGADDEEPPVERPPTEAALRAFEQAGHSFVRGLMRALSEEQSCLVQPLGDAARVWEQLRDENEPTLVVTLGLGAFGQLRLLSGSETLLPPPARPRLRAAPDGAIERVLSEVPVEVRVELGKTTLTMTELRALQPGVVLVLRQPEEDMVTVECAGVTKAYGRAVNERGAFAVEIVKTGVKR